jgi:prepilin signal peptidase PulO-like enzyme (type II secretory pathway)
MEKTLFAVCLFLIGLVLGSFVNAAVWRIKNKKDLILGRSECVHCHHILAWYDLIPLVSWIALRGKCRYCRKPISWQYPLVELGLAAYFVASLAFWPFGFHGTVALLEFVIWLLAGVPLAILFVYDLRWLTLPDKVTFPLVALGVAMTILHGLKAPSLNSFLINVCGSLAILSGFYLVLYLFSQGRWIGLGDVKLGAGLALLLCDWKLALMAFFVANLIGTLVALPGLLLKKIRRNSHIPFGPFLILGFIIAGLGGQDILQWYTSIIYVGINVPHTIY